MIVKRHDKIPEETELKFAVILAEYNGKWVFCRHKNRNTYEFPGGHHEQNETIDQTACRELEEETGAKKYKIRPLFVYSVENDNSINFGMAYHAVIEFFSRTLEYEIEELMFSNQLPDKMTYPIIQSKLLEFYNEYYK